MSKNLIKSASLDAFREMQDSALANSAFAIADEDGVIVAYKDEDGNIYAFQNGVEKDTEKHYYAVMSDGSKIKLDGMTEFTPTSEQQSSLVSIDLPSSLTTFSLSGCSNLTSVNAKALPNLISLNYCFSGCNSLTTISLPELPNVTSMYFCFEGCALLTSISLPELPNVEIMNSCFSHCYSLESLTIGAMGTSLTNLSNWYLSSCTKLSVDSLVNVLNALPTFADGSHTCTIGSTNLAKLSAEQIAIATAKNWTLN